MNTHTVIVVVTDTQAYYYIDYYYHYLVNIREILAKYFWFSKYIIFSTVYIEFLA